MSVGMLFALCIVDGCVWDYLDLAMAQHRSLLDRAMEGIYIGFSIIMIHWKM